MLVSLAARWALSRPFFFSMAIPPRAGRLSRTWSLAPGWSPGEMLFFNAQALSYVG